MTKQNLTEIVFLIDRSGSMQTIQHDMVGGMASFVENQKKLPDPCVVSLYQFDHEYQKVYEERPISEASLPLVPRGGTALLDGIGRCISEVGERLAAKPEDEQPGKVVFVVVTDGEENSSSEYTSAQVKDLVERQTREYNWQFAFWGANIDSFETGGGLGFRGASTMNYAPTAAGITRGYMSLNAAIGGYRSSHAPDAALSFEHDDKEKEKK